MMALEIETPRDRAGSAEGSLCVHSGTDDHKYSFHARLKQLGAYLATADVISESTLRRWAEEAVAGEWIEYFQGDLATTAALNYRVRSIASLVRSLADVPGSHLFICQKRIQPGCFSYRLLRLPKALAWVTAGGDYARAA